LSVIVTDRGIVLRCHRYGDTSLVAVLLTAGAGKIHGIAKGGRDPKNRFGSALQILAESEVVFYFKRDRDLHLIRSASLVEAHDRLLENPVRYHFACAAVEFADRLVYGVGEATDLHDHLGEALAAFESADPARLPATFKAFQLRFSALLGHRPHLEGCLDCPPGTGTSRGLSFGLQEGGLFCAAHRRADQQLHPVSETELSVLRAVLEDRSWDPPSWPARLDPFVTRFVEDFLRFQIDGYRGLRSLKSLNELTEVRAAGRLVEGAGPW
jgi:DNA repair protein RecO (recombination protein O)